MCGIAGIVHAQPESVAPDRLRAVVEGMIRALKHRGPDGEGYFSAPGVCLGHARLSIVDLENGSQPMTTNDGRVTVIFNGELYGFEPIRASMASRVHFRTFSDTEVFLNLYAESGPDFVRPLNGMFAYAFHEADTERVHLGVDALNIKPLYYYAKDGLLLFASELRALVAGMGRMGCPVALDLAAADAFLRAGWFPAPFTAVEGVRKLAPGERFTWDRGAMTFLPPVTVPAAPLDPSVPPETQLEHLLRRVVRDQLVADVPVGCYLSGGIDSSLLTALAAQEHPRLMTFNVGFRGENREVQLADESPIARQVAQCLGTEHHSIELDEFELLKGLDEAFLAMDEPVVDPAILPLYRIAQFARRSVTVALSGDGGDELFGGYFRHVLLPYKRAYQGLPKPVRTLAGSMGSLMPTRTGGGRMREFLRKARVGFDLLQDPTFVTGPFGGPHAKWLGESRGCFRPVVVDSLDSIIDAEIDNELSGALLPKTDRISGRVSLETRVPYLDQRVVAFAKGLPWEHKVQGRTGKVLLRKLLGGFVPEQVSNRGKHGFRVPLSGWFRGPLADRIHDQLDRTVLPPELIHPAAVQGLIQAHLSSSSEESIRLWALLSLDSWIRSIVPPPKGVPE